MVDHRGDWTYTLVIPRGHALEEARASESYRVVHECIAAALRDQGIAAVLKPAAAPAPGDGLPGICFEKAENFDVVNERGGAKIAGAAQKRNKHGLLFQGSIWRPAAGGDAVDWDAFGADFVTRLARALATEPVTTPWPEFSEDEVYALTENYSSPEWMEFR